MLIIINILILLPSHYLVAGRVPVHLLERVQHLLGELGPFLFSNHSLPLSYSCPPSVPPSVPPCPPCHIVIESTYIQVGVDTAKVRVSRSAKEEVAKEEKIAKEEEVADEENLVKNEVEDVPLLKPSIKADDSDAANAIQVSDFDLSLCIVQTSSQG